MTGPQRSHSARMPERLCAIELRLADGRSLHARVEAPVGTPDLAGSAAFAQGLAPAMGWDAARVDAMVASVAGLEQAPGVAPLLAACTG